MLKPYRSLSCFGLDFILRTWRSWVFWDVESFVSKAQVWTSPVPKCFCDVACFSSCYSHLAVWLQPLTFCAHHQTDGGVLWMKLSRVKVTQCKCPMWSQHLSWNSGVIYFIWSEFFQYIFYSRNQHILIVTQDWLSFEVTCCRRWSWPTHTTQMIISTEVTDTQERSQLIEC